MREQNFNIKPSIYYLIFLILFFIANLNLIAWLSFPIMEKIILLFFLSLYFWWHVWRYALLRSPHSVIAIRVREQNWEIKTDKAWYPAQVKTQSFVMRLLMVCYFKNTLTKQAHIAVILPDSMSKEDFKCLNIALRNQ